MPGLNRIYTSAAQIWLATCLLLLLINVLLTGLIPGRPDPNPIVARYGESIYDAYPDLDKQGVNQLLDETWPRTNFVYEPYTQFKEVPRNGKYVKVSEHGFRIHEPQAPWPPSPDTFNIFVFGGSTTFGYGVASEQTISARLQTRLSNATPDTSIQVYNFGRGFFFSTQERILFESLVLNGHLPDLAIFIDGANDTFLWKKYRNEPRFSNYFRAMSHKINNPKLWSIQSPLQVYLAKSLRKKNPGPNMRDPLVSDWKIILDRYQTNKAMVESVAEPFDIPLLFVWQPIPDFEYDAKRYHLLGDQIEFSKNAAEIYRRIGDHFHSESGNDVLNLASIQKSSTQNLYVDRIHYNGLLTGLIADRIYQTIGTEIGRKSVAGDSFQ